MKSAEEFVREGHWINSETATAYVKARDLEMWKQGMTNAAAIAELNNGPGTAEKIRVKRDQTKSV